ncbi:MAG: hypothetical protein V3V92_05745 [Candidatus Hydrothermarchaeales archaeon]
MNLLRGLESTDSIHDSAFQAAKKKINEELSDKKTKTKIPITPLEVREDILSTHLLLRSIAAKHGYPSTQSRTAVEIIKKLVRRRLKDVLKDAYFGRTPEQEVINIFSDILNPKLIEHLTGQGYSKDLEYYQYSTENKDIIKYTLPKDRILPLLRSADRKLTGLYLVDGHIAASLNDMVDYYCEAMAAKAAEVLSKNWQLNDPRADELAELVSNVPSRLQGTYGSFTRGRAGSGGRPLVIDHFPPCIKNTLEGVTTGSRNYAITMLLTSFLSYARIAPIGSSKDAKVSDYIKDISAVENEVLKMIEEAARHCEPPLFEDQPMEKMNVIYHLGFGLTNEPKLEDAGRSNWYFPPNCEKIQREAPSLCTPDAHCKTIKNPLSYYAKKLFPKKEKGKKEKKPKPEKAP